MNGRYEWKIWMEWQIWMGAELIDLDGGRNMDCGVGDMT